MIAEAKLSPVEYVFKRLAATYGAAWDRSLGQAPIADVMTVWDYQLQLFTQTREAKKMLMWALDNLPDRVPNVMEFKSLCRCAPAAEQKALEAPKADPLRVAAELAKLVQLRSNKPESGHGMKDWAHRLAARLATGEKLSRYQTECMNTALGLA